MKKIYLRPLLCILICCNLAVTLQAQTIRYVKQGGSGSGSDWTNASGDFQAMINASSAGDKVWVAAGDYRTAEGVAFKMKEGVEISGGFPNTGNPAWADRNWTSHTTRLLGNLKTWQFNGNRVIENISNGLTAGAVLDGFTLSEGHSYGSGHGGGMYNNSVSPTIRNCTFSNNLAGNEGGGMYNFGSNPVIFNCTFSNNTAANDVNGQGGGMSNNNSVPVITNCLFIDNVLARGNVGSGGGGMYNGNSHPVVTNCRFISNSAYSGGGVFNTASSPQFINTQFSENSGGTLGGGVYNYNYSSPVFKNCSFTNNTASNAAGAANSFYGTVTYINCLFSGNVSIDGSGNGIGGAMRNETIQCNVINCTITGNFASLFGGAIYSTGFFTGFGTNLNIRNSIIYGNNSGIYMTSNIANYENSLIQSYTPHGGTVQVSEANNIAGTTDPLFVNAADPAGTDGIMGTSDDGFRLQAISPVVNRGANAAVPVDLLTDLAGAARIRGSTVDMGAYESEYIINCGFSTLYVDEGRAASGTGDSWGTAFRTLSEAMQKAGNCNNINTILVAKGTYYPTGQQNGTNRDSAFLIPQRGNIKIYGGYPNGGGVRNSITNPTILSGDIGVAGNNNDNSYHILVLTEALPGADSVVVDGFTLTGANANGVQYYYNNVLTNQNEGGAILFRKNNNIGTKLAIRNCNIINNTAVAGGSGIYLWQSSALFSNCVIAGNTTNAAGAGLFNYSNTGARLLNCVFSGNSASIGTAVYNNSSSLDITGCTITGNTASGPQGGSGINSDAGSGIVVVNSILYHNGLSNIQNTGTLSVTYSNVQQSSGVFSGTGNVNTDPLFVNTTNAAGADGTWRTTDDGLKLQPGSVAVNAGTPDITALSLNPFDLAGEERVKLSRIDMGAYESSYLNCTDVTDVLYVDASVAQSGNGNSWSTALRSFAEAIDVMNGCNSIKTILLAKGTYYPTPSSNRDASFIIPQKGNVKIYGGYPSGGGTRDVVANPTILSGDIGTLNNNADNSYHVMVIANTDASADSVVVDGITFTGANGDAGSTFNINGRTVARNTGGGLTIIYNNGNTKMSIRNCRFTGNSALQGAGIYNAGSSPFIIDSYLQNNISTDNGGGMSNYDNAAPTLINVLITGNRASFGGAFFNDNSNVSFINATITGNYAVDAAGFYNRYNNGNMYFRNSILYGNRRNDGSASNIFNTSNGKAFFKYSLIENGSGTWDPAFGTDEGNNLFSDPLFANHIVPSSTNTPNSSGDYQLKTGSPAVDAGDNSLLPAGISTDIAGSVRAQRAATDLGAFESPYFNCALLKADTAQANIKCYGGTDGEASVTAGRGTAPYSYNWNNGGTTTGIINITAGIYTCTVTDANGCTVTKAFTISEPAAPLAVTITKDTIDCFGANDGSAGVVVTGGTAPYSYNWSNGATTADISSLSPGLYSCTVRDANGCEIPGSVTITQPAAELTVTATRTDVLCFGNNTGAVSLQVNGGTVPYNYLWSTGATGTSLTSLTAGTYTCTITDANGCSSLKEIIITQPAASLSVQTNQTNIQCYGDPGSATVQENGGTAPYTYNWSNGETTATIDNLTTGNYSCTITDANGCVATASVTIAGPVSALDVITSQTDILCYNGTNGTATVTAGGGAAPYSYSWSNGSTDPSINNLVAGSYTCTVTDNYGCSIVKTFTIAEPAAALAATSSQTNILCNNASNGSAGIAMTGGTAPYNYNWSNGGITATISDLPAGNYSCIVTDANGCGVFETFTITEPGALTAQIISQNNVFCNAGNKGAATIEVTGGVSPYTYQWTNGSNTASVNGLAPGNHTCVVTDANSCTINIPVNIAQINISGNKLYVDSSVAVSGNGSSWAQAFQTMSDAMSAAAFCSGIDTILVAKGTYYPTGATTNVNTDSTFLIRQSGGIKLFGGYPSGGGVRDINSNATVLSGELGIPGESENSFHVMVIAGIAPGADSVVVDGFVIKGGFAASPNSKNYNGIGVSSYIGAGIHISNNANAGGKISIQNCEFVSNISLLHGGAIYLEQSSPVISGCRFVENIAMGYGGGINIDISSHPVISLCEFSKNEGAGSGGAIFNSPGTHAIIDRCRFLGNQGGFGGAIGCFMSSPLITNCTIAGNKANAGGGGIMTDNGTPKIVNTTFTGNLGSNAYGGGLFNMNNSSIIITNCTFSGNSGWGSSGFMYNEASHVSITNTISSGNNGGITNVSGATVSASYSLIENWVGGTDNLDPSIGPMFVSYGSYPAPFTDGDYRLQPCSPAINAGIADTTGLGLPADALTPGLPRVQLGRIDIGAYEANSFANEQAATIPAVAATTAAYQLKDGTTWYAINCNTLIAAVTGTGGNPVSGNTSATVDMDVSLLPGSVSRFYEIEPDNNAAASSGTITLYFTQAEFSAYNTANSATNKLPLPDKDDPDMNEDLANVRIRKVSGGVESPIIPHTVHWNPGSERWELSFDVTSFSKFYVFTEDNAALPLRLISFTAKAENCMANIFWTTAEESAVSHFELEQSTDGSSWIFVSQLPARNTAGENKYNLKVNINAAVNFYRLKMVDADGATTYSKIVKLNAPVNCVNQIIRLYPNPVRDIVFIENANPGDLYSVYDNAGRMIMQGKITKAVQDINAVRLLMGMYTITIVNKKGEIKAFKFVKK